MNDKFNMYYDNAKKAFDEGKGELSKRNYMLAAETLLKLAEISSPELKKARVERAKRIIQYAESIDVSMEKKRVPPNAPENRGGGNGGNGGEEEEGKKFAAAEIPNIRFADIAGLEDVKKAITTRMINPLKYPEQYALYGKKTGGGVLLYGPPGTGKTMIAKAIACEVGATFYAIKGSDIVSKWVGESEQNINALFETARKDKLAIIFIDEMDSLIGKRGVDAHNDKRVNEFLQQIDGFVGRNPNLLLLGATNRPWDIDGAAMRSGRFSQKIYVPLPDAPAREFLFKKGIKNAPVASDISIDELVRLSEGYSGADIDEICDRAKEDPLLRAIKLGGSQPITRADFLKALAAVKPSVNKLEIRQFEAYTGSGGNAAATAALNGEEPPVQPPVQPTQPTTPVQPEPPKTTETKDEVEVVLAEDKIKLLPDEKPKIEFYVGANVSGASIKLDGAYYACEKHIRNFITEPLNVEAGEYTVEILVEGKTVAKKTVTFVKGIEENDFDI